MCPLSSEKRVQRAALALNNEAVTLLQQGHLEAAKKAFSSSLSMMETLLLTGLASTEEQNTSAEHEQHLLLRSLEHSRASWTGCNNSNNDDVATSQDDDNNRLNMMMMPFDIHAVEDDDFETMRSALQYGCSPSVFFPIILRDNTYGDDDYHCGSFKNTSSSMPVSSAGWLDVLNLSRQYSIALYNTAITFILCHEYERYQQCFSSSTRRDQTTSSASSIRSSTSNCHSVDNDCYKVARRLLSCSDSVLSTLATETAHKERTAAGPQGGQAPNPVLRVQLMLVSGLVLNALSLILFQSQKTHEFNMALQAVERLTTVLDQYEAIFAPTFLSPAA